MKSLSKATFHLLCCILLLGTFIINNNITLFYC